MYMFVPSVILWKDINRETNQGKQLLLSTNFKNYVLLQEK